jgi:hypothetical protein
MRVIALQTTCPMVDLRAATVLVQSLEQVKLSSADPDITLRIFPA